MNLTLRTTIMTLAGAAILLRPVTALALTYSTGDLLLGFHATGGQGAGESYVVDLGAANLFTSSGTVGQGGLGHAIGSLGTDLSSIYGASWSSRSDLQFGIAADTGSFAPGALGLPPKTLFATKGESPFGTQASPWALGSSTAQGTVTTKMETVGNALTGAATGTSPFGVHELAGPTSWAAAMPGGSASTPTTSFGYFLNGTQGIEANLGSGVAGTAVDLFEMQPSSTTGVPGTFLGSFKLDPSGNVLFSSVPEPSSCGIFGVGLLLALARRRMRRGPN